MSKTANAEGINYTFKEGEKFTLQDFIKKLNLVEFFECEDNEKDKQFLKRFAEGTLYFFEKKKMIKRVDTKRKGGRGRPSVVYVALSDIDFKIGEDLKFSENGSN